MYLEKIFKIGLKFIENKHKAKQEINFRGKKLYFS